MVSLGTLGLERCCALKKTAKGLYCLEIIVGCSPKDPRDIPELDALVASAVTTVGATVILVAGVGVQRVGGVAPRQHGGIYTFSQVHALCFCLVFAGSERRERASLLCSSRLTRSTAAVTNNDDIP